MMNKILLNLRTIKNYFQSILMECYKKYQINSLYCSSKSAIKRVSQVYSIEHSSVWSERKVEENSIHSIIQEKRKKLRSSNFCLKTILFTKLFRNFSNNNLNLQKF